jgi:porin
VNRRIVSRWALACALLVGPQLVGRTEAQAPEPTVVQMPAEPAPAPPPPPSPYAGSLLERSKLSGDWCGLRDDLAAHGFTFDISSREFYQGVSSGGTRDTFLFGGRADVYLNIDGEKAGLWKGLFITLHDETLYGASVNNYAGAISPVSLGQLVPVPQGPVNALTGVKVTQALSENFLTFGGKLNLLDEFKVPFTGANIFDGFMNSSLAFPAILARQVPLSTWGGGAAVLIEGQPIASIMVLDTNNTPTVTGFNTFFDNGATILGQATLPIKPFGLPGHHTVAFAYSSGTYTELSTSAFQLFQNLQASLPPFGKRTGSWSCNYAMDQAFWVDPENPKRSWGVFANAGAGDGNPDPLRYTFSAGFSGASPLPGRSRDSFGIGAFYTVLSDDVKNFAPLLLPLRDDRGFEFYYNAAVTPWFTISPDLQLTTPARVNVEAAVVLGVRAKIDF